MTLRSAELVEVRQARGDCLTTDQSTRWCSIGAYAPLNVTVFAQDQRSTLFYGGDCLNIRKTTAFLDTEVSMWIQVLLPNFAAATALYGQH